MVMAHALGLARNAARVDARKEQPLHGARQSLHRVRDARYIYGENPPNLADAWSTRTAANAGEINKVNGVEVRPKGHTLYIT